MIKKYWLVVALISINLFTAFIFINNSNKYKETISALAKKVNSLNTIISQNNEEFINAYEYSERKLSDNVELTISKNKKIFLKEITGEKKLVYRISDNSCSICYDNVIKDLIVLSEEIGNGNILILVPNDRIRELKSYLSDIKLEIPFYGVEKKGLGLGIDEYSPFFFVLDETMTAKHVFIPPKSYQTSSTSTYFEIIKSRYF